MDKITVEKFMVFRIVSADVEDGPQLATELLEYRASCGCICIFGERLDNHEKTLGYKSCERHEPYATEFLDEFAGEDAPFMETSQWMSACLEKSP